MTELNQDPVRLLDDPSFGASQQGASLQADLAVAADVKLAGLDLAGGLSSLKAAVAAEAGSTGVVAPIAAGGSTSMAKVAVGIAIALGVGAAWWGLSDDGGAAKGDPAPMVQAPETPEVPTKAPAKGPVAAPSVVPPVPVAPPVVVDDEPEEAIDEPVPDEEEVLVIDDAPAPRPHARKPGKKKTDAAPLSAEDAIEEASLISRARASLKSSPKQALSLTGKAKRQFPGGMLGEEREAIAIQALAELGRTDEANKRGKRFLSAHASSPHAAAVRRAIQSAP